jgi:hypothetical protein
MHMIKAIFLVGISIGLWVVAPILGMLMGTVALIIFVRFVLKEHADAQNPPE